LGRSGRLREILVPNERAVVRVAFAPYKLDVVLQGFAEMVCSIGGHCPPPYLPE
jgi:hypothetical protein